MSGSSSHVLQSKFKWIKHNNIIHCHTLSDRIIIIYYCICDLLCNRGLHFRSKFSDKSGLDPSFCRRTCHVRLRRKDMATLCTVDSPIKSTLARLNEPRKNVIRLYRHCVVHTSDEL